MYKIVREPRFDKSLKKFLKKRTVNIKELDKVITLLASNKSLSKKYKNHKLKGAFKHMMECHIHNDVLLLHYIIDEEDKLILYDLRTHDQLNRK